MTSQPNVVTVTGSWNKPRPNIDQDNEPFWEGLKQHKLIVWRCKVCGEHYWPKAYCTGHENEPYAANVECVEAKGTGKLFTFNIHNAAFHPGFKDNLPYTYIVVELDEGPLISAMLLGDKAPKDIYDVGQRVEIVYEDYPDEGFTIPRFRIVD